MSDTRRVASLNRAFRKVKIRRKSETNEWIVKRVDSSDEGYFTDDVTDAIATAFHMENEISTPGFKGLMKKLTRKTSRAAKLPVRRGKSRRSASVINYGSKSGHGPEHFEVTLREGGTPKLCIQAVGPDQYRRALVAADLWARGATTAQVEKAAGKHINK